MPDIEEAILLAVEAHRGEVGPDGEPRILHPLRVMLALRTEEERTVGVLHEVLESSDRGPGDLQDDGYPEEVAEAVDCLTRRDGEPHEAHLERIMSSPLARRVRIADLEDEMDASGPGSWRERSDGELEEHWRQLKELVARCSPVR